MSRHPGIRIYAFVQMSNHFHMVLEDRDGVLNRFMGLFLGTTAKAINRIDHVRGPVFERRYSAIPILDDEAFVDRIAYTLCNPMAANLVRASEEWPGLIFGPSGSGQMKELEFHYFHSQAYKRAAQKLGKEAVVKDSFWDAQTVKVSPLPSRISYEALHMAIKNRTEEIAKTVRRRIPMGVKRIVRQSPFDAPAFSKRSKMPLCHAGTIQGWLTFRAEWRRFVSWFRKASAEFRSGNLNAVFPPYSFRPTSPYGGS